MTDDLRDNLGGSLSRRRFFGRLGAAGLAVGSAGSVLNCADRGEREASPQTGAGTQSATPDVITRVRLRGRTGLWNVGLQEGRIGQISQEPVAGSQVLDGGSRLLTEGLVEHHIHLDKTLTEDRLRWDAEGLKADQAKYQEEVKAGRFIRGFTIWRESLIKGTFTEEDVFNRAMRLAKIESACGTTAIRSHAVVEAVRGLNCVTGLIRAREAMKPYMDLQIALHPQDDNLLRAPHVVDLVRQGMKAGADGVGGLPELDWDHADEYIDLVFRLAKETGGFVDMHADQGGAAREDKRMFSHPIIVAKTREYGLQGRVTASHSYSLAFQPRARVLPVLDEMREVGVHLSCSAGNYGEERVRIPRSRGVLVSLHNDNVRDPLNRGGKADLVEAALIYIRQMNLGSSDEALEPVFDLITTYPGAALDLAVGRKDYGLREGGRADLVLWDAESAPQVLLQQIRPAFVFKGGTVVVEAGRALWT